MDYIWYIVGVLVVMVAIAFPALKGVFINKKVTNALEEAKKEDKKIEEDVKIIEHKEIGLGEQEAKVDQKLEDLENIKINDSDISNFIDSLEKKK